jgi:hypothetical protein
MAFFKRVACEQPVVLDPVFGRLKAIFGDDELPDADLSAALVKLGLTTAERDRLCRRTESGAWRLAEWGTHVVS